MRRRLIAGQDGFSLIELLVGMVVAGIVFGAAVTALTGFLQQTSRASSRVQSQDAARRSVDRLAVGLRSAMSAGVGSGQPIVSRSDYDLGFLAPSTTASLTGNPKGLVHTRYCLDATTASNAGLWVQTAPYNQTTLASPPATAGCPSTSWATTDLVASNVVNRALSPARPVFTSTVDPQGIVTDVAIRAVIDKDLAVSPPPSDLQSKVNLRNVNRAPTAAMTCNALASGHIICDAAGSTDPEGQTLKFAWWLDAAALSGESASQLDRAGFVPGSSHTVQATVTDSGGLTASVQRTVTLP